MKKLMLSLIMVIVIGSGVKLFPTANAETLIQQHQTRDYGMNGFVLRREERIHATNPNNLLEYRSVATKTFTNFSVSSNAFMLNNAGGRVGASGWVTGRHQAVARSNWIWQFNRHSGEWRTNGAL